MMIREFRDEDRSAVMHLWNAAVEAGEVVYASMDDDYFERKFCQGPAEKAGVFLVAEEKDGRISGAIHGVKPVDLPGTKPGWSYLTFELVRAEDRGRGIGTALLEALKVRMKEAGAGVLAITSLNPVNLDWKIPGTPGHDHNNMPGLDDACQGAVFFRKHFEPAYHEIAMYRSFESGFSVPGEIEALQMKLRENGIETGRYNGIQEYEYETMCKRVGSPYWQHVLDTEIRAHHLGQPNEDPALWPDGIKPEGPRPLLIATVNNRIVGFTGPV
ncbi:MAG: GNAT family N-acetyltransferase, partial [Clostridia bacterium]|nr:GNAT family N-acetyltransferase [Clostridia bacterium]